MSFLWAFLKLFSSKQSASFTLDDSDPESFSAMSQAIPPAEGDEKMERPIGNHPSALYLTFSYSLYLFL
jgi:hypothetical protein